MVSGAVVILGFSTGCAFDLVQVKQLPVAFAQPAGAHRLFVLNESAEVHIGTGFPVRLRANTTWTEMGATQYGDVYSTKDQVLTVEASNIHEAALVVRDGQVAGFYLLIEKKFCPATKPTKLVVSSK